MKKEAVFRGTATAIITPFRDDKIDYAAYGAILENQIACGVDAIVVCGTTGEAATLDDREHREIVEYTVEKVAHRIPVDRRHRLERLRVCHRAVAPRLRCGRGRAAACHALLQQDLAARSGAPF